MMESSDGVSEFSLRLFELRPVQKAASSQSVTFEVNMATNQQPIAFYFRAPTSFTKLHITTDTNEILASVTYDMIELHMQSIRSDRTRAFNDGKGKGELGEKLLTPIILCAYGVVLGISEVEQTQQMLKIFFKKHSQLNFLFEFGTPVAPANTTLLMHVTETPDSLLQSAGKFIKGRFGSKEQFV